MIAAAVPLVAISFGILDWLRTEIDKLYCKKGKLTIGGITQRLMSKDSTPRDEMVAAD